MHSPTSLPHITVPDLAQFPARLRERAPRVHCITNAVAQNFTANVLLAAGAVPSMTISAEEIEDFVARADALLVNLGTLDEARRAATGLAIDTARDRIPWVLDPVFVERSTPRLEFARKVVACGPSVIRLNAAEFQTLAGKAASREAVMTYAREYRVVVALSGATDLITDGTRAVSVANGHPLMAKVTAIGCAGSAVLAGCLTIDSDALKAAAAALTMLGVAGEIAAARAEGPGSFAVALLDALHGIDAETIQSRARISQ